MHEKVENWTPIESDPIIWDGMMGKLGLNASRYHFEELLGLEEWAQAMIEGEVMGLILLYEETQKHIQFQKQENEYLDEFKYDKEIYFMKQFADNVCGTIAMFHTILNMEEKDLFDGNSELSAFKKATFDLSPSQRGKYFQQSSIIKEEHMKASSTGQSVMKEQVQEHYIALIYKKGKIYELDGMKKCPIYHRATNRDQYLKDACHVIRQILNRDPESINCSVIALVARSDE